MLVSIAFSAVIYRSATFELKRFAEAQQNRFERRIMPYPPLLDNELLMAAQQRMLNSLVLINITILGVSAILGYYLSGKTLSPIQEMMDHQYRFVSDASHELKTPITAIKTTLEVAIRDNDLKIKEARATLVTSLEEVNRLQKLAEGLLELTHSTASQELAPTELTNVVRCAIKTVEPMAREKKIAIRAKMPQVVAMANESKMCQALVAILDNAIKYSPKQKDILVSGKIAQKTLQIVIIDQGVGIKEQDIPLVFERFYRSDLARVKGGYGLGLPIAKQIIEDHGGKIEIRSTVHKGTKVIIALPYSARIQKSIS
jgi:signal transduction histidine kinase